jgi:hypothetical protein
MSSRVEGFAHLKLGECKMLTVLLKRSIFLNGRILAAESEGRDLSYDKAELSALRWATDWIKNTDKRSHERK